MNFITIYSALALNTLFVSSSTIEEKRAAFETIAEYSGEAGSAKCTLCQNAITQSISFINDAITKSDFLVDINNICTNSTSVIVKKGCEYLNEFYQKVSVDIDTVTKGNITNYVCTEKFKWCVQ